MKLPKSRHRRTVIFDLDETLIHCVDDDSINAAHIILQIKFKEEPHPINAGVNIRPGVFECLKTVG